jgi:hypothetical protein
MFGLLLMLLLSGVGPSQKSDGSLPASLRDDMGSIPVRHVGFRLELDKLALGKICAEYFSVPCQFSFHQMLHAHPSSEVGKIGQVVADV